MFPRRSDPVEAHPQSQGFCPLMERAPRTSQHSTWKTTLFSRFCFFARVCCFFSLLSYCWARCRGGLRRGFSPSHENDAFPVLFSSRAASGPAAVIAGRLAAQLVTTVHKKSSQSAAAGLTRLSDSLCDTRTGSVRATGGGCANLRSPWGGGCWAEPPPPSAFGAVDG
jgi:hypothetical protein